MKPAPHCVAQFRWPLALAAALAICTSGCLIIPTPEMNTGRARANITKQTAQQFEPGKSTRREVALALGEPDAVSPDERRLAYHSEKISGIVVIPPGSVLGLGGPIGKDRYLVFEFDERGCLLQGDVQAHRWVYADPNFPLEHWHAAPTSLGCTNAAPAAAGATPSKTLARCYFGQWWRGVKGLTGADSPWGRPWQGWLYLTESNLCFITFAQFANDEPAVSLPYAAVTDCRIESGRYVFRHNLVVRSHDGQVHSFALLTGEHWDEDCVSLGAVCEFIQSRVRP